MKSSIAKPSSQRGFSLIELLVVITLIVIMTAVTIFALYPSSRAYSPEDAALNVLSFIREAHQRAMSQRQAMLIRIDQANRRIVLIDEGTLAAGDESEVRSVQLDGEVRMDQPQSAGAPITPPPAPFDYPVATFSNGVWEGRFLGDGSIVDTSAAPAPLSATFFFWPTNPNAPSDPIPKSSVEVRAVTLFGPSGAIRYWRHDGEKFIAETR